MTDAPPTAQVDRSPRFTPIWIVPALAAVLALVLAWQSWGQRGLPITLRFDHGHGLSAGDTLRYRGIVVGQVDSVSLADDQDAVDVTATLLPEASGLARVGSRFWVVRPELGLGVIRGLDTVVGSRYIGVLPGDGPAQSAFVGLPGAPVPDALLPGLDILLEGRSRGSLTVGAPVTYRRLPVGSVLSVGLASDGRTVEATARIRAEYAGLLQEGTRFWDAGGLSLDVGITGLRLQVDSLETLVKGGVALAVPPEPGEPVRTGHRFTLHGQPQADWLDWDPAVAVGHEGLPAGAVLPRPQRAALTWTEGRFWSGDERREGWALVLTDSLLLPADLVTADEGAHEGTALLELGGISWPVPAAPRLLAGGLALVPRPAGLDLSAWPAERQRVPGEPEDGLIVAEPGAAPLIASAGRFSPADGGWAVDGALPLDRRWHGAAVLARSDGRLLGLLLVDEDDQATVAPLPRPLR